MPVVPTTAYSQAEDALDLARAGQRHGGRGIHRHAAHAAVELGLPRPAARAGGNGRERPRRATGPRARDRSDQRHHAHGDQRRLRP
jgi:hypothetical protein